MKNFVTPSRWLIGACALLMTSHAALAQQQQHQRLARPGQTAARTAERPPSIKDIYRAFGVSSENSVIEPEVDLDRDTLLFEDFNDLEQMLPAGWRNVDEDGLTPNFPDLENWAFGEATTSSSDSNERVALSLSWLEGFAPGNRNWLITPQVSVANEFVVLRHRSMPAQVGLYQDGYTILVSTTGNNLAAFTDTLAVFAQNINDEADQFSEGIRHTASEPNPNRAEQGFDYGVFETYEFSLEEYAGQDVYIAFLHNSDDDFTINLDDILVANVIPSARAQVIHNAPDVAADTVSIFFNDELLLDSVPFRTASEFIDLPAGIEFDLSVQPAGATDTVGALFRSTYELDTNETYIIVANGILPGNFDDYAADSAFNLFVYPLGREMAMEEDEYDLLVFHGAPDAPTVDVTALLDINNPTDLGTIIDNISYGEFADEGYVSVPNENFIFSVRDSSGATIVASYIAPLSLLNTLVGGGLLGQSYTVLASGFLNPADNNDGEAFGLFITLPGGGPLLELPAVDLTARVQVIHNAPDVAADTVSIFLNDELLLDNVAFRTASPFVDLPALSQFDLSIQPAGATDTVGALFNETYELALDETYVIVANGILPGNASDYDVDAPFGLFVYEGAREEAEAENNYDLLVFHGAPDAPTVDVTALTDDLQNVGTVVDDVSYGEFADEDYVSVPDDDYILSVRDETGATVVASFVAPLETLNAQDSIIGQGFTVLASGFLNPTVNNDGPAFGLFVALPSGGDLLELPPYMPMARVQVIHNAADVAADTVDVYLNDGLLLDNFAFRTATPFVDIPAGMSFDLSVQPGSSSDTVGALFRRSYELDTNETYVIVANGILPANFDDYAADSTFDLFVYTGAREMSTEEDEIQLLAFHGATDAPTVDIAVSGSTDPLFDDLMYGTFDGYVGVGAAGYNLDVRTTDGTVVATFLADLSDEELEGEALTVLASGFLDPSANEGGIGEPFALVVAGADGGEVLVLSMVVSAQPFADAVRRVQLFPNPAEQQQINVSYTLAEAGEVAFALRDLQGRKLSSAQYSRQAAGEQSVRYNLGDVSPGVYLLEMQTAGTRRAFRVVVR
ncbi:MAG: DUF4397 domain-containing protein [Catalinimonas sp.]